MNNKVFTSSFASTMRGNCDRRASSGWKAMKCVSCLLLLALSLTGCGNSPHVPDEEMPAPTADEAQMENQQITQPPIQERPEEEAMQAQEEPILKITVGEQEWTATFADNCAAEEFQQLLAQGAISVKMEDYGGFEKVGALGTTLTRDDQQITTEPGDIILYQGNQITIYYGTNTWSFTKLAHIDDPTDLQEKLGEGTVEAVFSLE